MLLTHDGMVVQNKGRCYQLADVALVRSPWQERDANFIGQ